MAIVKMKHLQVLALERDHDAILRRLQHMGCLGDDSHHHAMDEVLDLMRDLRRITLDDAVKVSSTA